jgi:hypothetical protein
MLENLDSVHKRVLNKFLKISHVHSDILIHNRLPVVVLEDLRLFYGILGDRPAEQPC